MPEVKKHHRELISFIKGLYGTEDFIPLHAPRFKGNEKKYLAECIDSTFVSSVGPFVDRFETMIKEITGAEYAVAAVNGTAALHMALILAGVRSGDEVITQPLTFVATCNAISYLNARPVFIDIDLDTLSLSPNALDSFLNKNSELRNEGCFNKLTGRRISAIVPMHTFGHPARIEEITSIGNFWGIPIIEDAAESLGSYYNNKHTGTFGKLGIFSFNGNKTVTCGGGGCIITNDRELGTLGKHLTTTAKQPHAFEFFHDRIGYNYRLPNLNAALACAQLEQLDEFLSEKRAIAEEYKKFCKKVGIIFVEEPVNSRSNYWLNTILLGSKEEKNNFLEFSNSNNVMCRPAWKPMHHLPAFSEMQRECLVNSEKAEELLVNLPSSVRG